MHHGMTKIAITLSMHVAHADVYCGGMDSSDLRTASKFRNANPIQRPSAEQDVDLSR